MSEAQDDVIYTSRTDGHRPSYSNVLSALLNMQVVTASASATTFLRLLGANRVLFHTLDDTVVFFGWLSFARACLGKKTVGLFQRPQSCFESDSPRSTLKRYLFRSLKINRLCGIFTIVPHFVDRRYIQVSHGGVFDPQFWDLTVTPMPTDSMSRSTLEQEVIRAANGRAIVTFLGGVNGDKGIDFVVDATQVQALTNQQMLFVIGGKFDEESAKFESAISRSGALVMNRFLKDEEFEVLYRLSSAVWACYAPSYDQASGIFGRSLQLQIPTIVREGSALQKIAEAAGAAFYSVKYGDVSNLKEALEDVTSDASRKSRQNPMAINSLCASWRDEFVDCLRRAL